MSRRARIAALWLAANLGLLLALLGGLLPRPAFDTDLLQLLPRETDAAREEAATRYADRLARRFVFVLAGSNWPETRAAAQALATTLRASPAVATVEDHADAAQLAALRALYAPHRGSLLAPVDIAQLQAGAPQTLLDTALQQLYSPAGWLRRTRPAEDPLQVLAHFLEQATPPAGNVLPRDGLLTVRGDGRDYAVVAGALRDSPFDTRVRAEAAALLDEIEAQFASPSLTVLRSGALFHAVAAARGAAREMSLIGGISAAGVLLLMLLLFRSARPLWLSVLVVGGGLLAGLLVCQALFGRVHVLTLVFGTSLIGLAVDYCAHYAADQLHAPRDWQPTDALPRIAPGLGLSLLTSGLGFLALAIAPLPALRQMAVFTLAGLAAAALAVLCLYPAWMRRSPDAPLRRLAAAAGAVEAALRRRRPRGAIAGMLLLALLLYAGWGLSRLHFQDDLRLLNNSPPALLAQEDQVRGLLGNLPDARAFLLRAADTETLLQREEALRETLDALQQHGALDAYWALSRALPSQARQARDRALIAAELLGESGLLTQAAQALRLPAPQIETLVADWRQAATPLLPPRYFAAPAAALTAPLVLGEPNGAALSLIALYGVHDAAAVAAAADAVADAQFLDRVSEISAQLRHFRRATLRWLALAFAVSALILALRYGLRAALFMAAVPLAAATLTLATLGALGLSANLFSVLGLLLVLGLGLDYVIFVREAGRALAPTLLALALSAATTLLAFGLLAFSSTPFIASLGLTLAIGISLAFLFACGLGTMTPDHEPG